MGLRGAVSLVFLLSFFRFTLLAQSPPDPGPNADPTYRQLRNLALGAESVTVTNVELKRDAATFHLHSGTVCFASPVNGKVTGAVFVGEGTLVLDPPISVERSSLKLLTKQDEFVERYKHLVLRFTDSTYEEIRKSASPASGGCDPGPLQESQHAMRHERALKYNLEARILQDVLGTEPGGLFLAFVHGEKYSGKEIFVIDPHGAPSLLMTIAPEEIEFLTYDENKLGVWTAFHRSSEYKKGAASGSEQNRVIRIEHQQLDTRIEKNARLTGKATTSFISRVGGLRVVPFDLYPTLRVESVLDEKQQPLSFIQEDKNDDAEFWVVLPRALAQGERYTLTTTYSGKDVVVNEGAGNYYPTARESWYPNTVNGALGNYAAYDMTFRIPKGMKMAATGQLITDKNEGDENVTVWKSAVPLTVAGFNFGHFKSEEAKIADFLIEAYANEEPPDEVKALLSRVNGNLPGMPRYAVALGTMSTTPLLKKALAEAEVSVQLYSDYFGPIPYKQLSVSQQTACNYGQSWPGLVYLPICYFYDTTIREQLGIEFHNNGYWKVVAPHEVAHQWWGHEVGFNSYRDQWMSEGFADASASIYLQLIEKNPKKFIEFWNDERTLLLERNKEGFRAIDAGPVTMGYRLSNERTGTDITRRLIYPKGAYILHMIRMMMWDRRTGDENFKSLMRDFASTYAEQSATTEDFKAIVEKHMTQDMRTVSNGDMDWFFNEYVYGTALPTYKVDYSNVENSPDGTPVLSFKVSQSGVDDTFRMLVPMYVEFDDGRAVFLGRARIVGNASVEAKVPLKGVKGRPKRAVVNYNDDVLATAH